MNRTHRGGSLSQSRYEERAASFFLVLFKMVVYYIVKSLCYLGVCSFGFEFIIAEFCLSTLVLWVTDPDQLSLKLDQ